MSSLELNLKRKCPLSVKEIRQGLERFQLEFTWRVSLSTVGLLPKSFPMAAKEKECLLGSIMEEGILIVSWPSLREEGG